MLDKNVIFFLIVQPPSYLPRKKYRKYKNIEILYIYNIEVFQLLKFEVRPMSREQWTLLFPVFLQTRPQRP